MTPLTDEGNESYKKQKVCYICKKNLILIKNDKYEFNNDENDENEFDTDENNKNEFNIDENNKNAFKPCHRVRDHCHYIGKFRGAAQNLRYKTPKKVPVIFHNGSTYDYNFIIRRLAKEFKFECLGENTEKYITFSVPIKKNANNKTITYKLEFIDNYRFISNKLSDLVDNLSEIYKKE